MENFEYKLLVFIGLVLAALGYVLTFAVTPWIGTAAFVMGALLSVSAAVGAILKD
ncbi:MAG TPA: hypothetical protein VEC01_04495 [Noviherbaspirillum sp.]|uniref:hypothetical protein n=1 Tax=Noviherbaspirillum sp. TaxID=1926288 RepID=UPI002D6E4A87|nr:hypothetical protein [Noviherbaspirillum sp.]HYD94563.1 hypothetical protein [Noviherbaspirillum sp.]